MNEEPSIASVINDLWALDGCANCGTAGNMLSLANSENESAKNSENLSAESPEEATSATCPVCQKNTARVQLVDNIIVCDNGSTDNTAAIAHACGAIVVEEQERGYGAACLAALRHPIEKELIVFVDGDHSVDCNEMPTLLDPLYKNADLVIGSRTLGHCDAGALSIPQRLGNRLASAIMRMIWKKNVTDLGPFRATSNQILNELQMQDRQFGWTVEMQVRALQLNKRVVEVPVTTRKRIGQSKISGTVRGVIGAAKGILGTIAILYWRGLFAKTPVVSSINSTACHATESPVKRDAG